MKPTDRDADLYMCKINGKVSRVAGSYVYDLLNTSDNLFEKIPRKRCPN